MNILRSRRLLGYLHSSNTIFHTKRIFFNPVFIHRCQLNSTVRDVQTQNGQLFKYPPLATDRQFQVVVKSRLIRKKISLKTQQANKWKPIISRKVLCQAKESAAQAIHQPRTLSINNVLTNSFQRRRATFNEPLNTNPDVDTPRQF